MKRSSNHILTTHMGSLPQPQDVFDAMAAKSKGQPVDEEKLAVRVREAVAAIVCKQADVGITVPNDGKQGKTGWNTYVRERLSGFDGPSATRKPPLEEKEFPDYYAKNPVGGAIQRPTAVSPIKWKDFSGVEKDVE